jgi:hypothetical protein
LEKKVILGLFVYKVTLRIKACITSFFGKVLLAMIFIYSGCHFSASRPEASTRRFLRLEMQLSAFGVEADHFPNADAYIDFLKDSSKIKMSCYNPKHKDSSYSLTTAEIGQTREMLEKTDFSKLRNEYPAATVDMPTCRIKIFTDKDSISIIDHGAVADRPLPGLYEIVFKL